MANLTSLWQTKIAKTMVGVMLSVDSSQSLTVVEYIKQRGTLSLSLSLSLSRALAFSVWFPLKMCEFFLWLGESSVDTVRGKSLL